SQHRPGDGVSYVQQAIQFYQGTGFRKEVSQGQMLLGRTYDAQGDFDKALGAYETQLRVGAELGDQSLVALAHDEIARVLNRCERYPEAIDHVETSLALYEALGNAFDLAFSRATRAELLSRVGREAEAGKLVEQLEGTALKSGAIIEQLKPRI